MPLTGSDVIDVVRRLLDAGARVWIDGGWGVEAHLGRQSREHDDLDLAIGVDALTTATRALAEFHVLEEADPSMPTRLVLRDRGGRQVDLHPLEFDPNGDGWQTLPDGSRGHYPSGDLTAVGRVNDRAVPCVSAQLLMAHHAGYEPDLFDWYDVQRLRRATRLATPDGYADQPRWIHYRRKSVVVAMLGWEPPWKHLDRHRLHIPSGLVEALRGSEALH
jgi:lincosamide nucleotidyltransferase A/C/D/E